MHPRENIIALKAAASGNPNGQLLQVYNVPNKKKLKDITFNEKIVYWKW